MKRSSRRCSLENAEVGSHLMTSMGVGVDSVLSAKPIYWEGRQMLDNSYQRGKEQTLPNMKQEAPSTIAPVPNSLSWTTIDSVQVPCFSRRERNYIPARLVEERLLSQYPSNIDNVSPLIGCHATQIEVQTLNDVLAKTNSSSVTVDEANYSTEDVLVKLEDFLSFYDVLKRRFNEEQTANGGWLQVNNIVIPYVYRARAKLVPIEIIRNGGRLLTNVSCTEYEVEALTEEVYYLNRRFETGGFSYSLQPSDCKLIDMALVLSLCEKKPRIRELPADDPMVHASFDDTAIIEIQSSASSSEDSDVEVICEGEVIPILIQPNDDGEDETCGAQGSVQMENSECGALPTVALQTPTAISHTQSLEAMINNTESDVSALLCRNVSDDSGVDVRSPLTNAGNGQRDSASCTKGKSAKRRNPANVEKERPCRKRTKTTTSTGDLTEKRKLAENAELIRRKKCSALSPLTNVETAPAHSLVNQFKHRSNSTITQFNLRPGQANRLIGNDMRPSNGSSNAASVNCNTQPYSGFPGNEGMPRLQGSMYIRRMRFPSAGLAPTSSNYQSFPRPYTTPHYHQNTMVSAPRKKCDSLNVNGGVASRSNDTVSRQSNATGDTVSSLRYGVSAPNGRNGFVSVQPNGAVPSHTSEIFLPQYNNTSPNRTVRSCHGNVVLSRGNNMTPDNSNGTVPLYHRNTVLSHGNNMIPDNSNGTVPSDQGNMNLSNRNSMTSGMSNETFIYNRNATVSDPSREQIVSAPCGDIFSGQRNELLSPIHSRNGINNEQGYLTGEESYPLVNEFQPHSGHLYSGAMVNRFTYPNHNPWNQQQSSMVPPSTLESSSMRSLEELKTKRLLSRLLETNGDSPLYPSAASASFPTGSPLPGSLEPQSTDLPICQEQPHQSSQCPYLNNPLVNKTNAVLTKRCSDLTPPKYQSTVQNNGHASAVNSRISDPTARSSQPSGQKFDYSQTRPWTLEKKLANSGRIVIATLFGKRVFCLAKNKTLYFLLESLQRNFFKDCSLESWLYMVVHCGAKTITLTEEEEIGFIECYKISCDRLNCNSAIAIEEFCNHLPSLRMLYNSTERIDQ